MSNIKEKNMMISLFFLLIIKVVLSSYVNQIRLFRFILHIILKF